MAMKKPHLHDFGFLTDDEAEEMVALFREGRNRAATLPNLLGMAINVLNLRTKMRYTTLVLRDISVTAMPQDLAVRLLAMRENWPFVVRRMRDDEKNHSNMVHRLENLMVEIAGVVGGVRKSALDNHVRRWANRKKYRKMKRLGRPPKCKQRRGRNGTL